MDVINSHCNCSIYSGCKIDKCICECAAFCHKYKDIYDKILLGNHYWYTLSPPMKEYETDDAKLDFWLDEFVKLLDCCTDFIIVVEFDDKMRLHFHMMIRTKDDIKFKRSCVQRWYFKANNDIKRMSQPVMGMHYLFKQSETTQKLLNGRIPILTAVDIIKHKTEMKSARLQFKNQLLDEENYD